MTYKLLIERTIVNETILYNVSDVIIMMIKRRFRMNFKSCNSTRFKRSTKNRVGAIKI